MGAASKWASSSHVGGKGEIWERLVFFCLFVAFSSFFREVFSFFSFRWDLFCFFLFLTLFFSFI